MRVFFLAFIVSSVMNIALASDSNTCKYGDLNKRYGSGIITSVAIDNTLNSVNQTRNVKYTIQLNNDKVISIVAKNTPLLREGDVVNVYGVPQSNLPKTNSH